MYSYCDSDMRVLDTQPSYNTYSVMTGYICVLKTENNNNNVFYLYQHVMLNQITCYMLKVLTMQNAAVPSLMY